MPPRTLLGTRAENPFLLTQRHPQVEVRGLTLLKGPRFVLALPSFALALAVVFSVRCLAAVGEMLGHVHASERYEAAERCRQKRLPPGRSHSADRLAGRGRLCPLADGGTSRLQSRTAVRGSGGGVVGFLANRKAKKQAEEWQAQRDTVAELLERAETFQGDSDVEGLMLKPGERAFAKITGAALVETRTKGGHWEGRSTGLSVPIGHLGHSTVRARVGKSRGHYVAATPVATAIDTGTFYITNQRALFAGSKQARECVYDKLISFSTDPDGTTTFAVTNRQKATTIHYGPSVLPLVASSLDLAMAHHRGTVPQLVAEIRSELQHLDANRPAVPA